ncbi:helix-turn-helix domain-containing protein [Sporosarcina sp. ACRSL]|uniref:helix-turn-helix domain-containing protein n=1 Tax=Sporosarcina sp. ACRSL TaxID=2918215 RepID=UPI001EF51B53|nr:helix-turn-helix transcriptional regulator [Sporosarcina sp. ACRSL]MCG7346478.1 helix-turn-helix domain-containing protein [Sporosarcina sp. ACRSL]
MHIGSRIRRLREREGLTQKEASSGIISTSHYSNIESGRFEPSSDVLEMLAERLNSPIAYFQKTHEDDACLQQLLTEYEELLSSDLKGIPGFLIKHSQQFTHIPSITQEIMFNLLKYTELLKVGKIPEAQTHYSSEIAYIPQTFFENASKSLFEKYTYTSALFYYFNKDYEASISHFEDTLYLTRDESLCAKINYNISLVFFQQFDYGTAHIYAKRAKRQYMHLHNWAKAGDCYNLIAALYLAQHKTKEAKRYIDKGFSVLGTSTTVTHGRLYHNLAFVQMEEQEYIQALETVNKCIELKKKLKCDSLFDSQLLKLRILFHLGDLLALRESMNRLQPSNELNKAHLDYVEAKLYYALREYDLYEQKMKNCIHYLYANEDWKVVKDAARHLSIYYEANKKYKNAYKYQELCIEVYRRLTMELKGGEER